MLLLYFLAVCYKLIVFFCIYFVVVFSWPVVYNSCIDVYEQNHWSPCICLWFTAYVVAIRSLLLYQAVSCCLFSLFVVVLSLLLKEECSFVLVLVFVCTGCWCVVMSFLS